MEVKNMRRTKDIKIGEFTLEEIIVRHQHYLNENCEGWEDMCANLTDVDLRDADLMGVNLSMAKLFNVNLSGANLSYADLSYANLTNANLYDVYLINANLTKANLSNVDLSDANLSYADLDCADLSDANLSNANLARANLSHAYLSKANLNNTRLIKANLSDTILNGAIGNLIEYRKGKMLTESIIGYKKCEDNIIVTLEIPRGAIVFSINGNKCRTNKAKVIAIDGADRAYSTKKHMSYYIDDEITIYDFNCEYNIECAKGIHFFMTRKEAKRYN